MSGRRAKAVRRAVYGADHSPRARQYWRATDLAGRPTGTIISDARRRAYQQAKARV